MFKAFKVSSKSHRLETKARSISCVWEFPHRFSESNSGFSSSNRKVNILRFINLWFSWNFQTKIKFLARAQVFLIKNSSCGNNIPTARHVTPACYFDIHVTSQLFSRHWKFLKLITWAYLKISKDLTLGADKLFTQIEILFKDSYVIPTSYDNNDPMHLQILSLNL